MGILGVKFTHNDLVEIGYKWCLSRCAFAFKELNTINTETPDVIGFNSTGSFLLEAKISKSDFIADKNKTFRQHTWMGMGDWRFFITPKDLITVNELPEMWGLIEVNQKGKAKIKHNPFGKGNIYSSWEGFEKNKEAEKNMMYSVLRRLQLKNLITPNI